MRVKDGVIESMKLVYIASPYAGDIKRNEQFARKCCLYAMGRGCCPIAVHLLYPQILNDGDPVEREKGLKMGLRVLESCDELWVCGSTISQGMAREIREAERLSIDIVMVGMQEIMAETQENEKYESVVELKAM